MDISLTVGIGAAVLCAALAWVGLSPTVTRWRWARLSGGQPDRRLEEMSSEERDALAQFAAQQRTLGVLIALTGGLGVVLITRYWGHFMWAVLAGLWAWTAWFAWQRLGPQASGSHDRR